MKMKKLLMLVLSMALVLSSIATPVYAENSKYWTVTTSFTAPELTDKIVIDYMGKTKDVVIKDLKTRDISAVEDDYDRINVYVVGTVHAYTLILDEKNKVVGTVIRKSFYADMTEQKQHDAFVDKCNSTLMAMKKEKGFQYETTAEDAVNTYATCTLKNGRFMEFMMSYEVDYEYNIYTDVYISYFLSPAYVPQG